MAWFPCKEGDDNPALAPLNWAHACAFPLGEPLRNLLGETCAARATWPHMSYSESSIEDSPMEMPTSARRPAKPTSKKPTLAQLAVNRAAKAAARPLRAKKAKMKAVGSVKVAARPLRAKKAKKKAVGPVKAAAHTRALEGMSVRIFDIELPLASTDQRVELIRAGVPAIVIEEIGGRLGMPKRRLYESLKFPRATIDRKIKEGGKLSPDQSERILGLQRLVQEVGHIVDESGDPAGFDAPAWVGRFLEAPWAVLGGRRPAEYMDTIEGQQLVINLLRRVQAGVHT